MPADTLTLKPPAACPGCGGPWSDEGACARCSLERAEADTLLTAAAHAYNGARAAAAQGRFGDARRLLDDAEGVGLGDHPAVRRLRALCDSAAGAAPVPPALRDAYEAARSAATQGEGGPDRALALLAPHLRPSGGGSAAPLPLYKLALLCVAARPGGGAAEEMRGRLLDLLPAEPDLSRWRFAAPVALQQPSPASASFSPSPVAKRQGRGVVPHRGGRGGRGERAHPRRPAPRPTLTPLSSPSPASAEPRRWRTLALLSGGASLGAIAAAGVALAFSFSALRRPVTSAPIASNPSAGTRPPSVPLRDGGGEEEAEGVPAPSAPPLPAAREPGARSAGTGVRADQLPDALARERGAARAAADLRTARRWFNEALRAHRTGDHRGAMRLSRAVHALVPDTYLGPEALLLYARTSDTIKDPDSAARWARIADEYPRSDYAPLGLWMAARSARRRGHAAEAAGYAEELRRRYPDSREATRTPAG